MALKLTFKKDYGSGQNKVLKGQSIVVDAYGVAALNYDKIKLGFKRLLFSRKTLTWLAMNKIV